MGSTIGSVNPEKPVSDLLRLAVLSGGGRRLRVIIEKLLDKAEPANPCKPLRRPAAWLAK